MALVFQDTDKSPKMGYDDNVGERKRGNTGLYLMIQVRFPLLVKPTKICYTDSIEMRERLSSLISIIIPFIGYYFEY